MKQVTTTSAGMKKCLVQKYVKPELGPPFKFETVGQFKVERPFTDPDGTGFYETLVEACQKIGEDFAFYSISENDSYDYTVTVR